ncbi:hypothetical protein WN48_03044 [Eufriesea mexicana]|uniref:ATP synthase F(0) complex subunit e, mitochondrial n=1 Tax=Eufriesea mexicana TaxID=516756 RepID=A0A310S7J7_9HYME|nr:hypothetical protein WN48_03044 [Eufriesea mexicana]
MSSVQATVKPLNVSPVIKFFRWTFLLSGIVYGLYFQKKFSKRENALREQEERERPMKEAKLAAEKKLLIEGKKRYV